MGSNISTYSSIAYVRIDPHCVLQRPDLEKGKLKCSVLQRGSVMMTRQKDRKALGVGRGLLKREHLEIQRSFVELDEALVWGHGPTILLAAENLIQLMLLHFIHKAQLLEKCASDTLPERYKAEVKFLSGINEIDSGLKRQELSSALYLRSLCKEWIRDHMYDEGKSPGIAKREGAGNALRFRA